MQQGRSSGLLLLNFVLGLRIKKKNLAFLCRSNFCLSQKGASFRDKPNSPFVPQKADCATMNSLLAFNGHTETLSVAGNKAKMKRF
jgi:hypothetical protein